MAPDDRFVDARQSREWAFTQLVERRLRQHRARHVIPALGRSQTQIEVAKRLERPQSYVSNLENGMRKLDVAEARDVAKAYEIDLAFLLAEPR
jgi:transcriptional regulator with XRE-family HTH domain